MQNENESKKVYILVEKKSPGLAVMRWSITNSSCPIARPPSAKCYHDLLCHCDRQQLKGKHFVYVQNDTERETLTLVVLRA